METTLLDMETTLIEKEEESSLQLSNVKRIGIACDHGGYDLKVKLLVELESLGYTIVDFGAYELVTGDDFPDFVIPLARAVANKTVFRGLAICGSGVGACIVANKLPGVRAALITETFSAHQGVEDDDMNVLCLGGRITGYNLALEVIISFLQADFKRKERFIRRLGKIETLERERNS